MKMEKGNLGSIQEARGGAEAQAKAERLEQRRVKLRYEM